MKKITKKKFFLVDSNHIILDCKINNIWGSFILDTGASNSCINTNSIDKFNLNVEKSTELASSATNEITDTYYSKDNKLEISDLVKTNFEIFIFDMSHINKSLNQNKTKSVDGIIGVDILREYCALIDLNKKELTLKF